MKEHGIIVLVFGYSGCIKDLQ